MLSTRNPPRRIPRENNAHSTRSLTTKYSPRLPTGVKQAIADFVASPDGNPLNVDFMAILKRAVGAIENWIGIKGIGDLIGKLISGGESVFDSIVGLVVDTLGLSWDGILELAGKALGDESFVMGAEKGSGTYSHPYVKLQRKAERGQEPLMNSRKRFLTPFLRRQKPARQNH